MVEVNKEQKSGNPILMWGLVVFLVVGIAVIGTPMVMRCSKKATMTEATSNAKQIFYLLIEFDQDYGRFPGDATAIGDLKGYQGEYSNDYLAQFIEDGYTKSEEIFYAKGGSGSNKKPDNVTDTRASQLSEGECGFAYVKNLSTKSNTGTPILLAPMYGDGYKFNTDIYQGKAVVLRVDGAVKQHLLNKDRHAKIGPGKTLFDGGTKSVWGEKGFDSTQLCYAKKPYDFVPKVVVRSRVGWIVGVVVVLIAIVIFLRKRSNKRKQLGW